jgi:transcriptional regulator with XRE-family HTH domain
MIGTAAVTYLPSPMIVFQVGLRSYHDDVRLTGMGDDTAARNPLGPVGRQVIDNVRQLREARKLTYTELSGRLTKLGRPIPVLGLSRIEKGRRRVDADDLVALALALRVNPGALLLPRSAATGGEPVALTAATAYPAEEAWWWADGHGQLPVGDGSADDFLVHARPEYEVRGKVETLDRLARDALAMGHHDFADLARQDRDDLGKLARDSLPGFASEEHAAAYAAWQRSRKEEEAADEDWEREHGEPSTERAATFAAWERRRREADEEWMRQHAGDPGAPIIEGGKIAEDRDD